MLLVSGACGKGNAVSQATLNVYPNLTSQQISPAHTLTFNLPKCGVCVSIAVHTWEEPCFLKPALDLPVTPLSTGVRQHSDMSGVPPRLIHVYTPNLVCPSVSLSGLLRLLISPEIFSGVLAAQVVFKELTDAN